MSDNYLSNSDHSNHVKTQQQQQHQLYRSHSNCSNNNNHPSFMVCNNYSEPTYYGGNQNNKNQSNNNNNSSNHNNMKNAISKKVKYEYGIPDPSIPNLNDYVSLLSEPHTHFHICHTLITIQYVITTNLTMLCMVVL